MVAFAPQGIVTGNWSEFYILQSAFAEAFSLMTWQVASAFGHDECTGIVFPVTMPLIILRMHAKKI